jgi:hypothetical protein
VLLLLGGLAGECRLNIIFYNCCEQRVSVYAVLLVIVFYWHISDIVVGFNV